MPFPRFGWSVGFVCIAVREWTAIIVATSFRTGGSHMPVAYGDLDFSNPACQ